VLFTVLCLIAFALVLLMNRLTVLLSLAGWRWPRSILHQARHPAAATGARAAFGWAVRWPMRRRPRGAAVAWLVFIANILWSTAYDTLYAMVDRETTCASA